MLRIGWEINMFVFFANTYYLFQFRALSDQFYRSLEHHKFVRQVVVNQVCEHNY